MFLLKHLCSLCPFVKCLLIRLRNSFITFVFTDISFNDLISTEINNQTIIDREYYSSYTCSLKLYNLAGTHSEHREWTQSHCVECMRASYIIHSQIKKDSFYVGKAQNDQIIANSIISVSAHRIKK